MRGYDGLKYKLNESKEDDYDVVVLRRLVMINLLEEYGFKDDTRRKLKEGSPDPKGIVPQKPNVDNVNSDAWAEYVNSLSGVPPIGALEKLSLGGALKGALTSAASEQLDKMKFWKGISERKTWSDGKNGQILFATSKDTFCMNDNGIGVLPSPIEASISKPSDANNILGDTEKETLEGYVEKLRKALRQY